MKFYFRFRFKPTDRHRHPILRRHSKFHVNRTIGGVVMTSLKFSRWRPLKRESTSGSGLVLCMSSEGHYLTTKFCKHVVPRLSYDYFVSNKERPPYLNSTSGFDFNLAIVISISFCVSTLNFK